MAEPPGANYDETKVPSYTLPDPLVLASGEVVRDAATWRERRRPEILRLFEEHVYGRSPERPRPPQFSVFEREPNALDGQATRKQIDVRLGSGTLHLLVYLPRGNGQHPLFLGLNFGGNHTLHPDPSIRLPTSWVAADEGAVNNRADGKTRGADAEAWPVETLLARGYGLATAYYGDLEPDHASGFADGVRARFGPGASGTLGASDWGALSAWAFGLRAILDVLEADPDVDATRVALIGHSRLGKTALWAGAQDERFALVISNESGEGGAALARRRFGETVAAITRRFPHWFCPRFAGYADRESDLPVDQHLLLALIAPRPLYVGSAEEDRWADPRGEFLSALAAEPAYRLLGQGGLGVTEMPPPDHPVGATIGYHVRRGPHAVKAYDWERYLAFADRHLSRAKPD